MRYPIRRSNSRLSFAFQEPTRQGQCFRNWTRFNASSPTSVNIPLTLSITLDPLISLWAATHAELPTTRHPKQELLGLRSYARLFFSR